MMLTFKCVNERNPLEMVIHVFQYIDRLEFKQNYGHF